MSERLEEMVEELRCFAKESLVKERKLEKSEELTKKWVDNHTSLVSRFIEVEEQNRKLSAEKEEIYRDFKIVETENAKYEEALEFYANRKNYVLGVRISMGSATPRHEPIKYDKGAEARRVLGGVSDAERNQQTITPKHREK